MESDCSFVSIVGGHCGHDRRDRNKGTGCIPLLSCQRDINRHKEMFAFHGIVDEIDLILARESIFSSPRNIDQMTIYVQLIEHHWVLDGHAEFWTNAEYHQYYQVIVRM